MATTTTTIAIDVDTRDALRALGNLQNMLLSLAGIGTVSALASQFLKLGDAATTLSNKMRSVTASNAEAQKAFDAVLRISRETGASVEAVGDLFQKMALNGNTLGLSLEQIETATGNFTKALAITGTTGSAATSAIYQLGQALGRGTVAFEDLKQIQEVSAATLALIAKQFGKTTQQFLTDVQNHRVGSQDLARAIKQMGDDVNPVHANMAKTAGQAFETVRTEFVKLMNDLENNYRLFSTIADAIIALGRNLDVVIPLIAALLGAFAAARLAAIVTSILQMAAAMRTLGLAAAVTSGLATGGIAAIAGIAGATAAYLAGVKMFDKLEADTKRFREEQAKLAEQSKRTQDAMKPPLGYEGPRLDLQALSDEAKKYGEINRVAASLVPIGRARAEQERAVLEFAKQNKVEYDKIKNTQVAEQVRADVALRQRAEMSKALADQELGNQARIAAARETDSLKAMRAVETQRLMAQYEGLITKEVADRAVQRMIEVKLEEDAGRIRLDMVNSGRLLADYQDTMNTSTLAELAVRQRILDTQNQLGYELTREQKDQIAITEANRQRLQLLQQINQTHTANFQDVMAYQENINAMSATELDTQLKILAARRQYGAALTPELEHRIRVNEEMARELDYLKQIKREVDAVNRPLVGAQAGAAAAGQLGSLLDVEKIQTDYQTMMNGLADLRNRNLISEEQYNQARVTAHLRAEEAMYQASKRRFEEQELLRIRAQTGTTFGYETQKQMAREAADFEKKSTMEKTQFGIQQAATLFSEAGKQNEKAFQAAKAFNIANAVMNTYMAATKALATYPFPFGLIAAAAAVAAGMAQVSAIRSQSFSGRALGGPVIAGQSYIVGERGPEMFTPATSGRITRNDQLATAQPVTVNFNINTVDAAGFDTLLVARRGLITSMIQDAQTERGRKL